MERRDPALYPIPMRRLYWLPAATWALLIFYMSTRPMGPRPAWWFDHADKVIHAVLFGVQAILLLLALRQGERWPIRRAAATAFALAVLYGASDEIHQFFTPTRTPDWADLAADAAGAATVFLAAAAGRRDPPSR